MGIFFTAKIKDQIADLQDELKRTNKRLAETQDRADRAEGSKSALESDLNAANERNVELNRSLEAKSAVIEEVRRDQTAEQAAHEATKVKLAKTQKDLDEANKRVNTVTADLKSKSFDLTSTQAQVSALNTKLEKATTKSPSTVAANELGVVREVLTRYKATNPVVKAINEAVAASKTTASAKRK